jgi:hypothetical protein
MITYDNTYDETEIDDYLSKDCVYIIHIKDNIYKFGYSSKLDIRLNTHKNKIKFYILDNINQAKQLEKQIKYFLKKNNLLISYENQKEIFQTDDIDSIIDKIDKFTESIKNKNLEYNNDTDDDIITEKYNSQYNEELKIKLEFEKEKTKQIQSNNNVLLEKEKTKQLELNFINLKIIYKNNSIFLS